MKTKSQLVSEYRRKRKDNLIKVCGSACNICGYQKSKSALEFHHINPEEKEYGIAANGTCHDLEKDLAEVKKCILVCANCHREIHDGFFTLSELNNFKKFDENFANELRQQKEKKKYYCLICGKEIQKNKNCLCQDCFLKHQAEEKNYPDRAELKNLIRNYPFTKIGEKYHVSDNAIRKLCKKYDLPNKKTDINKINDNDWEKI